MHSAICLKRGRVQILGKVTHEMSPQGPHIVAVEGIWLLPLTAWFLRNWKEDGPFSYSKEDRGGDPRGL